MGGTERQHAPKDESRSLIAPRARAPIRRHLSVGRADDPAEIEADRMADAALARLASTRPTILGAASSLPTRIRPAFANGEDLTGVHPVLAGDFRIRRREPMIRRTLINLSTGTSFDADDKPAAIIKLNVRRLTAQEQVEALRLLTALRAPTTNDGIAISALNTSVNGVIDPLEAARQREAKLRNIGSKIGRPVRGERRREAGVWVHSMEPQEEGKPIHDAQPRITSKDRTPYGHEYHMQFNPEDESGFSHITSMATIASHEGFTVVVSVEEANAQQLRTALQEVNADGLVRVVPVSGQLSSATKPELSEWAEDSGEFLKTGEIGVQNFDASAGLEAAMEAARHRRGYISTGVGFPDVKHTERLNPAARIGKGVNEEEKHLEKQAIAHATERSTVRFDGYVEGGNLLAGTDLNGNPYALVGRDSIAATASLRGVDDGVALKTIADDLGLSLEQVIPVEQPGQFHLDMGIAIMGGGTVLLNDSRMVRELMLAWLAEDLRLAQSALSQYDPNDVAAAFEHVKAMLLPALSDRIQLEERAFADLKGGGAERLKIKRVPASFPQTRLTPEMNFLNGESGTGPDGRSFFITNGGDARAEDVVSTAFFEALRGTQLARMYFVDSGPSEASLMEGGGIGCRTKTAPPKK
jgi:hypothetical protein